MDFSELISANPAIFMDSGLPVGGALGMLILCTRQTAGTHLTLNHTSRKRAETK